MKKSLSVISAAVLAASCLPFTDASTDAAYAAADGTAAAVRFYMEVESSDKIEIQDDGIIHIDPENLTEDISLTANIYFSDPQKGAWSVSPKWNSASEYIKITNIHNPLEDGNLKEFAYAAKDADGNLSNLHCTYNLSTNTEYGSTNFTVRSTDGMALVPYGAESDSYPLISFDFTIDADAPDGRYDIYFTEDADNSTRCAMDAEHGNMIYSFPDCPPDVSGITIYIGERQPDIGGADDYLLGDVNEDGKVDSVDASLVLAEYGLIQTGGELTFTHTQKLAADVNKDEKTDSSDASKILEYYGAVSTGKNPSWD